MKSLGGVVVFHVSQIDNTEKETKKKNSFLYRISIQDWGPLPRSNIVTEDKHCPDYSLKRHQPSEVSSLSAIPLLPNKVHDESLTRTQFSFSSSF